MAIFFSAAALAGSFGGLLAAAIANMDDLGGKEGWAWIFILEGLATIVIGVISFWMVYDFPDEATFLSDVDRKRVLKRLSADQQASAEHEQFKMAYFWNSLKDWKTYTGMIIYMGADGSLYAFSLFVPTIINELVSYVAALQKTHMLTRTATGLQGHPRPTPQRAPLRCSSRSDRRRGLHG
jgi:MFS family permease